MKVPPKGADAIAAGSLSAQDPTRSSPRRQEPLATVRARIPELRPRLRRVHVRRGPCRSPSCGASPSWPRHRAGRDLLVGHSLDQEVQDLAVAPGRCSSTGRRRSTAEGYGVPSRSLASRTKATRLPTPRSPSLRPPARTRPRSAARPAGFASARPRTRSPGAGGGSSSASTRGARRAPCRGTRTPLRPNIADRGDRHHRQRLYPPIVELTIERAAKGCCSC